MGGNAWKRTGVQVWRARPTMNDVAREAGVALKTVSRVVNGEPGVSLATAERVNRAITRLRYRRNDLARRLRSHAPTAAMGLVVEDVTDPFSAAIVRAAEEVVRDLGWVVVAGSSDQDGERERRLVAQMVERQVDGMLIVPAAGDHRYLLPESRRGMPVVFLDRPPVGIRADTVLLDNRAGARAGVADLVGAGHRRIGVVGGRPALQTVAERMAGYRDALAGAGLPFEPQLARLCTGPLEEAEAAARSLLSSGLGPTALFALSGHHAVGVVRAAVAAGRPVAVLTFGAFDLADLMPCPVTVVDFDAGEMGRRGAEMLLDRLDGNAGPPRTVVLPTRLRSRASGATRSGSPPT